MGVVTGLWQALVSALADTIQEVSGNLMGRLRGSYTSGGATITLGETHRWPDTGRIALNGVTGYYAGKTSTTLTGVTDEDGNVGLDVDGREGDVCALISSHTDMDYLRDSFFVGTAEGSDLDTLGRNYGLRRVRGMDDDEYRAFLMVAICIEGGTVYAMEKVLDAVIGVGAYTLYEDLENDKLTVYVILTGSPSADYQGKAYLVGLEAQARVTTLTVDVDETPTLVYGVWASTDPGRLGTNYAEDVIALTETPSDRLVAAVNTFDALDTYRYVVRPSDGAIWKILSVLDARTVQVGTKTRTDGETSAGDPTTFTASERVFRDWMVGHTLVVLSGNSVGTYSITAVGENGESLTASSASFVTETDITWFVRPSFTPGSSLYRLNRAKSTGNTITTPVAMPANVLVDYTTIPSAQAVEKASKDGSEQYAFYLFDETYLASAVLDMIRAAGVRVVVTTE